MTWNDLTNTIKELKTERDELLKMLVEVMPCINTRVADEFGECDIPDIWGSVHTNNPLCYKCIEDVVQKRLGKKESICEL